MISDQERRDIAEGLRDLKGECVPLAYVLGELDVDCDGADVPKAHVERLADLIDRPTCVLRVSRADYGDGFEAECSRCGAGWVGLDDCETGWAYCPNCGAKAVCDDD